MTKSLSGYNSLYFPCFSQYLLYNYAEEFLYIFLSFYVFLISETKNCFCFLSERETFLLVSTKTNHDTLKMMFS